MKCKIFLAILFLVVFGAHVAFADGIIILPPEMPRLSIKYHKVNVTIDNQVATTYVDQIFVNESPFQMEGTYIFPLPEDVSISEFAMYVGGERLKAELLDKDTARKIYEDIVRSMRDPAILEYIGRNMFRARVFPIEPNSEKRIQLEYSELLQYDAGLTRYLYPLNTEKFSAKPLQEVSVRVDLTGAQPLKTIYSPSHKITVTRDGEYTAHIIYADENVKPDTDFILYYSVSAGDVGLNLLTHREPDEAGFYLLMLAPQTEVKNMDVVKKNVAFVLDTSGSMRGDKINQAKETLKFCISALNSGDTFNIVDFSTEVRQFSKQPALADASHIPAALHYVDKLEAIGGTNINDALLLGLIQTTDAVNMIIFLTDGLPTVGETNNERIIENVTLANVKNARIFVFGVGYDVNTHLLDKIAGRNSGVSDYVRPDEDIEVKVSSFFAKISNPVLSNALLEFSAIDVRDTYPRQIPDIFAGMQLIQFGRYTSSGSAAIYLTGEVNSEEQRFTYEANFPAEQSQNDFIPRLWATRKIGYLMDEIRLHGESQELVDEIVYLSKKYGIITPYTSFLITEDEPPLPGEVEKVLGPQMGFDAVAVSGGINALKDAESADGYTNTENMKVVGKKAFFLRDEYWTDSEYVDGQWVIELQYGSDKYFNVLATHPELGKYFALGLKVIVCSNGACYRVQELQAETTPPPWDVNQDYTIDIFDLVTVGKHLGEKGGTADINKDGIVNIADLILVGIYFGKQYAP